LVADKQTGTRCGSFASRWPSWHRIRSTKWFAARSSVCHPHDVLGEESSEVLYAVVVQANEFMALSTTLVAPTSTSARPATFRPTISLDGTETRVLIEQTRVVDRNAWAGPPGASVPMSSEPSTKRSLWSSAAKSSVPGKGQSQ
jgi:mRNA-degrading endonuclease toxin of MazEF toxin-antitoxin module